MNLIRRTAERVGRFVYNAAKAYYEYASDLKPVKGESLMQTMAQRIEDGQATMRHLYSAYQDGQISLNQWRDAMATELRRENSQLFALGRGGWKQVTADDRVALSERLRQEFDYLRQFARDIADGKVSEAQALARIDMYAEHARASFWAGQTAAHDAAGFTQERRVLDDFAKHCQDCVNYADAGWSPVNSLPEPGVACECRGRCKCSKIYRV